MNEERKEKESGNSRRGARQTTDPNDRGEYGHIWKAGLAKRNKNMKMRRKRRERDEVLMRKK